ncbi:hypothetical protein C1Y41_04105 [Pantoea sp. ICBG 1758]|uniref:M91 family zinc metallopeptidase n=1 Tax=Pantoea sp. ICBG 1758 TaxID=2071682 RepID=UPI000CE45447|nr:M91 family zinc metallopeptidase [Pantoea sp. ICBG 1758]PPC63834.1 hypothetical protein C1Y41_04105 [Pantoea sp. ICBG 1758]
MHIKKANDAANIYIHYENPNEVTRINDDLFKIKMCLTGRRLLREIESHMAAGKNVNIKMRLDCGSVTAPRLTESQITRFRVPYSEEDETHHKIASKVSKVNRQDGASEGTSATISYNPRESISIDSIGRPYIGVDRNEGFFTLAHELIHALHMLRGNARGQGMSEIYLPNSKQYEEENRVIGINEFAVRDITENRIRQEWGAPLRAHYFLTQRPI